MIIDTPTALDDRQLALARARMEAAGVPLVHPSMVDLAALLATATTPQESGPSITALKCAAACLRAEAAKQSKMAIARGATPQARDECAGAYYVLNIYADYFEKLAEPVTAAAERLQRAQRSTFEIPEY